MIKKRENSVIIFGTYCLIKCWALLWLQWARVQKTWIFRCAWNNTPDIVWILFCRTTAMIFQGKTVQYSIISFDNYRPLVSLLY